MIEREDIILWRRRYLTNIRKYRAEGRKIYYLDETWVNSGHTKTKIWKDTTILNKRQAFVDGLSTGLRDPSGKGQRLIVLHIGSDSGFVDNGLLLFQSKKTGDYHEDMNSQRFIEWMHKILPSLDPGSIIVMDNAPYHSTKLEKSPTSSWRKDALVEWLTSKGVMVDKKLLRVELLEIVKTYKDKCPVLYEVDEMVRQSGRIVLRLPPYHCNLNPIELVWAQVKHHVAANNKTFKIKEVNDLLLEGLSLVNAEAWKSCIKHSITEENKMYDIDNIVDDMVDNLIITANTGSSSESSDESDLDIDLECYPI